MTTHNTALNRTSQEEVSHLLSRTKVVGSCMQWVGAVNTDGYPKLSRRVLATGKHSANVKGHRHIYEHIHNVCLNPSDVVRHTCDNPLCLNPNHLLIGSCLDNVEDRVKRYRSRSAVTQEEIALVKQAVASSRFKTDAAKSLGIPYKRLEYILAEY